jgi:hypothetical protein
LNTYYGNGLATSKDSPSSSNSNNFGVGLVFGSNSNLIEENKIGGNVNGIYVDSMGDVGNKIRRNIITGNPPAQASVDYGASIGADIQDKSTPGTNVFEDNICLTYAGAHAHPPCPNISKTGSDEARRALAASAFGSSMAFPQARVANVALHQNSAALPKTAEAAKGGPANDSETVTVIGKVVDAACYMVHASAATNASHKDCGVTCLARGVPLAIATDDGTLYFPADGNQQLKALLNTRVRASETIVEKSEPMELKMPVGDKNQMVVRVEGGYKQITLQTLEKVSPTQHHGAS